MNPRFKYWGLGLLSLILLSPGLCGLFFTSIAVPDIVRIIFGYHPKDEYVGIILGFSLPSLSTGLFVMALLLKRGLFTPSLTKWLTWIGFILFLLSAIFSILLWAQIIASGRINSEAIMFLIFFVVISALNFYLYISLFKNPPHSSNKPETHE